MSGALVGLLVLTHSSRRTNLARCGRDFLVRRFADPGRLHRRPPFAALPPARPLYSGAVSFHRVERTAGGGLRLAAAGAVRHRDKVQHAAFLPGGDLLVGFEHRVERWRPRRDPRAAGPPLGRRDFAVVARHRHPHLAGLHTVEPLAGGRAALSCAAADAVLVLDLASGDVVRTLRLPEELYGAGYPLAAGHDFLAHYPDDERQATHLNAAAPSPDGRRLAVSAFIPGAVGVLDLAGGGYRELVRGAVGCHGARFDGDGGVSFVDSAAGDIVLLDDGGGERRRVAVGSRWLHDALRIDGDVFACALSDANELRLVDAGSGRVVAHRRFATWPFDGLPALARRWPGWLGNSTQALSWT